jgi:hypothetical protein
MPTLNRQEAKDAGYSDEEIDAFLKANPQITTSTAKQEERLEPPPPTTEINEVGKGAEAATIAGAGAAGLGGAAAIGAGAYGVRKAMTSMPRVAEAMQAMRQGMGAPAAAPARPPGPVQPTQSVILDSQGRPMQMPQPQPAARAQPQAQPGMMDRIAQMARTYGPAAARMAGGAAAAAMPSNIGQGYNFPQAGPMRGMEINPMTGRPWTREELAAYERNPNAFNSGFAKQLNMMSR